jgi:hypothetical protein
VNRSGHEPSTYFRCQACRLWHTSERRDAWGLDERHDRCIRRLPGVNFACCGHGRPQMVNYGFGPMRPGYISADRGVIRFPGDVHPFLVRAAVARYLRTGRVPSFARADDRRCQATVEPIGCRFRTPLDQHYRCWSKRRRPT